MKRPYGPINNTIYKVRALTVAGVAVTALLAACSSSGGSSNSADASRTTASDTNAPAQNGPALTGPALKFGVISSDSGATGVNQDTPTTARLWQNYVNSHGGVGGHPVQVIVEDDGDNPATALQDFIDLVQNKHVIAIGDDSYVDQAFEKAADTAKIPVIGLGGSNTGAPFESDPNFFADTNTTSGSFYGAAKIAALSGASKMAALYCSEVAQCALLIPALKPDAQALGVSLTYGAAFSTSSPDYTAQCVAARSSGAQAMFVASTVPSAEQRLFDDCAQQGYHPTALLAGQGITTSIAEDPNVPVAWGLVGSIPWFVRSAATAAFHQAMDNYLPKATSEPEVAGDWAGLQLFATAAATVGVDPSAQDVYAGLYALHANTLGGLTAPLTFQKGKPNPVDCAFVFKISDGRYSTPAGTSALCK
jgi:branched-chain amino acid transport system substrate-binding protein